jgi:two-component system, cell cycle response regulator
MNQKNLAASLREIQNLLSHLHGEVAVLETSYSRILLVLERFENAADFDDLTGLMRRRTFFRQWQALLTECERLGQESGVLMIDIDHFKRINDTHGHPTGDEVIARIATLLKQFESPSCHVSRIGGEEFAIAARGTDAELLGMAEMIRRGAERLHGPVIGSDGKPSSRVEWKCTLSVGMASVRGSGSDASRLLKTADDALYAAKRKGRNQVNAA